MTMNDVAVVRSPIFLRHECPRPHPENARRLSAIDELFVAGTPFHALPNLTPRGARPEELARVHALEMMKVLQSVGGKQGWIDADTYYTPESLDVALAAAGGTIDLSLAVWRGDYRRGFSLVRPPGHHATPDTAMGFCLLNNIALAAAAIRHESPSARVAIVDFDLHHGNGTQDAFYADPAVLFLSSHRFPFYPGTGADTEVGEGKGKGTTINFPLSRPLGDPFFVELYGRLAIPALLDFAPDIILVSAGFDGHVEDPMRGFAMETETYSKLARLLIGAAEKRNGKIVFVLEGGYSPSALKASVQAVLEEMISCPRRDFAEEIAAGTHGEGALLQFFVNRFRPFFPKLR